MNTVAVMDAARVLREADERVEAAVAKRDLAADVAAKAHALHMEATTEATQAAVLAQARAHSALAEAARS